jgi:hypothetical protein
MRCLQEGIQEVLDLAAAPGAAATAS